MNTAATGADQSVDSNSRQAEPGDIAEGLTKSGPVPAELPSPPHAGRPVDAGPLPDVVQSEEQAFLPGVDEASSAEGPEIDGDLSEAVTQPEPVAVQPTLDRIEASQLLLRFLVGSAILGADELVARLRGWQAELDAQTSPGAGDPSLDEATTAELARYVVLGSLAWGSKRTARAILDAFRLSLGIAGAMRNAVDRLTDNPLLMPLRRPVDAAIAQMTGDMKRWIYEGWHEEQASRSLAGLALSRLLDESFDLISEDPHLARLVRSQIGEQSVGLAGVVVDNSRALGVSADDAVETLVRRIFRRGQRSVPPSVPAGQDRLTSTAPNEDADTGDPGHE